MNNFFKKGRRENNGKAEENLFFNISKIQIIEN